MSWGWLLLGWVLLDVLLVGAWVMLVRVDRRRRARRRARALVGDVDGNGDTVDRSLVEGELLEGARSSARAKPRRG